MRRPGREQARGEVGRPRRRAVAPVRGGYGLDAPRTDHRTERGSRPVLEGLTPSVSPPTERGEDLSAHGYDDIARLGASGSLAGIEHQCRVRLFDYGRPDDLPEADLAPLIDRRVDVVS